MHDAVVLGVGGVGSFALRALARRGARVLGLERFRVGHDRGSSHGGTRVFRHAYFEHADYVPLLRFSTGTFRALEQERGVPLLEPCGTLLLGPAESVVLTASVDAAREHGITVEELGRDALAARHPQFALPDDYRGVLEPDGGFVRPEAAMRAAVDDALAHGAQLREEVVVERLEERGDRVVLTTSDGVVEAARAVVCAGAWAGRLLADLAPRLRVTRQVQGWLAPRDASLVEPANLPAWFLVRESGPALYGVPTDPLRPGAPRAKVALHGRDEPLDPDDRRPPDDADRRELEELVERWLPRLAGPLADAASCTYTTTPDEQFVVDRAPGHERTWVAAGLSGHGFKLTPALGHVLAELALDGGSTFRLDFLSAARFA